MSSTAADHLCVLVHGLWGNPSHLSYLETTIQEAYPDLYVLVAKSNANSYTYDGIELGGERIAHEIEKKIEDLEEEGHDIKKISIIGYSLGGLVARYAIGLLYSNNLFDTIQPVNFTTFATPHLGVRTPSVGPHSYLWNILGARTLSTSGNQLFTVDSFRDTGRPLLSVMADPNSIFLKALSQFKHRSLYCNIINDRSAVYYTTGITNKDPYVDLDAVKLRPLPGYDGVILRPEEPVRPKPHQSVSALERLRVTGIRTLKTLPLAALFVVLIPIGSVLFLMNSGYQTIRSAQRIKLHEGGHGGFSIDRYRLPLIEEARHISDRVYERLTTGQSEEYLPTPPSEAEGAVVQGEKGVKKVKGQDKFPTLALTPEQFSMIEALDEVGFVKYPVHISKVRHSHAAMIVRSQRKGFSEGKIVVGHWIENFEI
ncbi:hypothetical protein AAFC00_004844 [Neodothiora populina]|uniref:DUF676 domain-containing protein n=1 Tax=Neodothiora populina TaxID=2781224 RepID=A0ABR3P3P6_9PEZI